MSTRTEAEIITAILAGETRLYHELVRLYERSVYMMVLSYMKNEADAEDVAQEAFIKAFRNPSAFHGDAKFSTRLIHATGRPGDDGDLAIRRRETLQGSLPGIARQPASPLPERGLAFHSLLLTKSYGQSVGAIGPISISLTEKRSFREATSLRDIL